MLNYRLLLSIQFVFVFLSMGFSQDSTFQKLDNSNALNPEYANFQWARWKVIISIVNPILTSASFIEQQKCFKDISPNKSFYNFLIENITNILTSKSQFASFEWHSIPLRKEVKIYGFKENTYSFALPDSSKETFRNTGCRFALLFQEFHSQIRLSGHTNQLIPYPSAVKKESIDYNPIVFSFSYVLYDLLDDRIVQFGKAFDDDNSRTITVEDVTKCLKNALTDFLEVSKFYYKK
jgi:hypothetical protein